MTHAGTASDDGSGARTLHDLALIYIAMAHGTDQDLDASEVEAIAERLRGWQHGIGSNTVLSAIKDALELYTEERATQEVAEAIGHLASSLSDERRRAVMDDLEAIALADGRVVFEESMFIQRIKQRWGLHDAPEDGALETWSILQQEGLSERWSLLHDVAFVFLTLACQAGHDLSDESIATITQKVGEWLPDAEEAAVLRLLQQVMDAYEAGPVDQRYRYAVAALREHVPPHQRTALFQDLQSVAEADGVVPGADDARLRHLARLWGDFPGTGMPSST